MFVKRGLAVICAGAVDLTSLNADRSQMQDAADAAALAAARQLGVATNEGSASLRPMRRYSVASRRAMPKNRNVTKSRKTK